MSAEPFLDANILVHAFTGEDHRTIPAGELIAAGGRLSVQLRDEVVNVSRRKLRRDWADRPFADARP